MADHGGQTSLPRAHRPRAPIMSVPAPITAPLAPLRSSSSSSSSSSHHPPTTTTTASVSLVAPRPDCERQSNEYVDTPFRAPPPPPGGGNPVVAGSPPPPPRVVQRVARLPIPPPPPAALPVTKQPQTTLSKSRGSSTTTHHDASSTCDARQSIICGECGRCRCQSCQQPRPLPECWTSTYRCSADTVIDYASCLCCVKGLFYHCSETDGGDTCVDEPCNCGPDRRAVRWCCLAAVACVLPCLLLYWPMQCGKRAVEACYARHSRLGCRCRPKTTVAAITEEVHHHHHHHHHHMSEKRLLDAATTEY